MESEPKLRIVVDAMGGDFAPAHEISGTLQALQETNGGFEAILVGKEEEIREHLRKQGVGGQSYSVVNASEVITMEDSPTAALKQKKDSSLAVGMRLHQEGKADAFVSAGNTGAVLSASTLILGRVKGVGRPTIGAFFPSEQGVFLLLDAGTNVDCRAQHLYEFAVMGSVYVKEIMKYEHPTVALLNVGEEKKKGTEIVQETYRMLETSALNFIGNVEGRDLLAGKANVVVCDGFVGNVLLKFGESVPSFLKSRLKRYAKTGFLRRLLVGLMRNPLRASLKDMDYEEYGGVPVLGVNGVSIIGHGSSSPKAIKNMILKALEVAKSRINRKIEEALAQSPPVPSPGQVIATAQ
ncbi:MAG: phosphate acyltransferase PlsX [Ignavibacteriales bacterium]|nr:phosphate acyltransferase PlsX [Ignavibacteriales bacterium]MBI3005205.1 phosphate acyltransferase PlsX [Ignavibacteriales bacterium]